MSKVTDNDLQAAPFSSEKGVSQDDVEVKSKTEEALTPVNLFKIFSKASSFEWFLMFCGLIFAAGMGILMPVFLIVYGDTIDKLNTDINADFQNTINDLALLFVYLGCTACVAGTLQVVCFSLSGERQAQRLKELYVHAILRQDIAWFEINSASELSSRVNMTAFEIQDGIGRKMGDLCSFAVQGLACLAVGFWREWQLALVLFCASFPLMSIAGWFLTKVTVSADTKGHEQYAKAGFIATEVLSGIRTVASLCGEKREILRYESCLEVAEKIGIKKKVFVGIASGITFGAEILTYALGLWYGVKLSADGLAKCDDPYDCNNLSGGDVIIVLFAILLGGYAVAQMTPGSTALNTARMAGARVFDVLERTPPIDAYSEEGTKPTIKGDIELDDVFFSYPTRPLDQVCNGYSLSIKAGETVALVGPSGSGKSTFMNLVLRFYDPKSGTVKVDGEDIRKMNLKHYRKQIGYVKQEPVLFSGTIRENIKFGCPDATDAQVEIAAKQANALHFIKAFPDGFDTQVGEAGGKLSGGQKQRIAIARALISNPPILLLDEATSALDNDSERLVQEALNKLKKEKSRTVVIIAHRLKTIKDADKIAVIEKGQVQQFGSHSELMADKKGVYYGLWTAHGTDVFEAEETEESMKELQEREASMSRASALRSKSIVENETGMLEKIEEEGDVETGDKKKEKPPKVPFSKIWPYMKDDWYLLLLGCLGGVLGGGVMPAAGAIMAWNLEVFYYIDEDKMRTEAANLALIFVGLSCSTMIGFMLLYSGIGASGEKLTRRVRQKAFDSMIRHEISWFDWEDNSVGSLTTRLSEDCKKMQSAFGEQWGMQTQIFACLAVALTLGFYFSWRMGLVVFATLPANAIAGALMMATIQGGNYENGEGEVTPAGALLSMAVNSMTTVTALNLQQELSTRYAQTVKDETKGRIKKAFVAGFAFAFATAILYFSFALMFWYASTLIKSGKNSFKEVMAAILALIYAAFGLGQASVTAGDQKSALVSATKIFKIIDAVSNFTIDVFSKDGDQPTSCAGSLEFKNVHFHYPTRPDTQIYGGPKMQEGYNLEVKAGQTVALVGPSGGGKSTAMSLLMRFYEPQSGKILLDGTDITKLNVKWLRSQIGYVGQEPVLFAGSIRENICYGNTRFSDEDVIKAAKSANAHNFIGELQGNYDADVGENSALLSGGQKQRIAIARAIIRDPKILLLDEATSALDNESEKIVQDALDQLQASSTMTTLVIAHRFSTIQKADMIAVVQDGGVVETGTHDELILKEGYYYQLNAFSGAQAEFEKKKSMASIRKLNSYHELLSNMEIQESPKEETENSLASFLFCKVKESLNKKEEKTSQEL